MTAAVSSSESTAALFASSSSSIGAFASRAASVEKDEEPIVSFLFGTKGMVKEWISRMSTHSVVLPGSSSGKQQGACHMEANAQALRALLPYCDFCKSKTLHKAGH